VYQRSLQPFALELHVSEVIAVHRPVLELLNFLKRLTVLTGIAVASIHFTIFAFLFESPPFICSGSNLLTAIPFAPTYFLSFLPIISDLLYNIANSFRIEDNFLAIFVSSCYYGLASGLLVSRQIKYRLIGLALICISILFGLVYYIYAVLFAGCGA
jgi:hypothetical protein